MPDMPGLVARPRFLRLHDDFLNADTDNRRRFGLALLRGDELAAVYRQLGIGSTADWRHLEREFYAEEGPLAYWPYDRYGYLGNKQAILRQGVLEAIRIAENLPASKIRRAYFNRRWPDRPVTRRLESLWLCSGNRFEVDIHDGENQVTMLILTPAMPALPDNRKPKLERPGVIWTVGRKDVLAKYRSEYRSDQTHYPSLLPPYRIGGSAHERSKDLRRLNKFDE